MTNNNGLLPCPFCGGYARPMRCQIGIEGTMGCNKWVTITCSMCEINNGGKGGFMRPRYDTEEEAAKAWNTRSQPQNVEGDLSEINKEFGKVRNALDDRLERNEGIHALEKIAIFYNTVIRPKLSQTKQEPNPIDVKALANLLDKWDNQGEINHEELCLFIETSRAYLKASEV